MFERNLARYRCPIDLDSPLRLAHDLERTAEGELVQGVLHCPACDRHYPVMDGIPHLVRDALRHHELEAEWLQQWRGSLPAHLVTRGLVPGLADLERTEADLALLDESKHWGLYLETFESLGDTAILDIRMRGNHPTCYELGVLETDQRDSVRRWGIWPNHLSEKLFPRLAEGPRGVGLDLGCGGGQLGLEAARQGIDTIGQDISHRALAVARRHARREGVGIDYVYADMARLPFAPATFDWLLCKDALHHIPGVSGVLEDVAHRLLKPGARVLVYDHVNDSWLAERIRRWAYPKLARKIQHRYELVDTPKGLFGRDSANEKAGSPEVLAALDRLFEPRRRHLENRLYFDMEALVYYAYGRRLWFARMVSFGLWMLDPLLRAVSGPEFVLFDGVWRGESDESDESATSAPDRA